MDGVVMTDLESQIEVTPEMLAAGCLALSGIADIYTMATNIYRAMEAVRLRQNRISPEVMNALMREAAAIIDRAQVAPKANDDVVKAVTW